MAGRKDVLPRIVALKRQKAEQDLAVLQARQRQFETRIKTLQEELAKADSSIADFQALRLASQNGHARRLLQEVDRVQADLAALAGPMHLAREALKRILNSEDQLARDASGR